MTLQAIVAGNYGYPMRLVFVGAKANAPADISAYNETYVVLKDPKGVTLEKAATFETDGSDGVVLCDIEAGDIDEPGKWTVRIRVASAGTSIQSLEREFLVHK